MPIVRSGGYKTVVTSGERERRVWRAKAMTVTFKWLL